jgi:beta-lactamase class A
MTRSLAVSLALAALATPARAQSSPVPLARTQLPLAVADLAARARGRLGVGVEILETGDQWILRQGERFPMQSVYKLPIGMAVLDRVDRNLLALDSTIVVTPPGPPKAALHGPTREPRAKEFTTTVRDLLRANIEDSDETACDVLLRVLGGPERVQSYLRRVGVSGVAIATTEQEMVRDPQAQYRNWATPEGALAILRTVYSTALTDSSRSLLVRHLIETKTGPRRLRAGVPQNTVVAHQTGSSAGDGGLAPATNDIGVIRLPDGRHLAVAVLLADSRSGEDARDAIIAGVARAAWDAALSN